MTLLLRRIILALCLMGGTAQAGQTKISIIIDDLGYGLEAGRQAISLPGKVTVSILPRTPYALVLAAEAHAQGKEVLLHLPMQAHHHDHDAAPALHQKMNQQTMVDTVRDFLASVPYAQGVNNHQGSLLSEQSQPMSWLMAELKHWNLYFVDSRTTPRSVAQLQAQEAGLPTLHRHIFLDHDKDFSNLETRFNQLLNMARNQGYAVAIGHPHAQTLAFLQQRLPQLQAEGIELVTTSKLAQLHSETPTWQASLSPSPKAAKN